MIGVLVMFASKPDYTPAFTEPFRLGRRPRSKGPARHEHLLPGDGCRHHDRGSGRLAGRRQGRRRQRRCHDRSGSDTQGWSPSTTRASASPLRSERDLATSAGRRADQDDRGHGGREQRPRLDRSRPDRRPLLRRHPGQRRRRADHDGWQDAVGGLVQAIVNTVAKSVQGLTTETWSSPTIRATSWPARPTRPTRRRPGQGPRRAADQGQDRDPARRGARPRSRVRGRLRRGRHEPGRAGRHDLRPGRQQPAGEHHENTETYGSHRPPTPAASRCRFQRRGPALLPGRLRRHRDATPSPRRDRLRRPRQRGASPTAAATATATATPAANSGAGGYMHTRRPSTTASPRRSSTSSPSPAF